MTPQEIANKYAHGNPDALTDEQIDEYYRAGGKAFRVIGVDRLRDGGSVVIQTDDTHGYWIDKRDKELRPTPVEIGGPIITDEMLKRYIIKRLVEYLERLEIYKTMSSEAIDDIAKIL